MYLLRELETPATCIKVHGERKSIETILVDVLIPDYLVNPSTKDVTKAQAKKLNNYFESSPTLAELKKNGFRVCPCIKTGEYQIRSRGHFPSCQDLSKLRLAPFAR